MKLLTALVAAGALLCGPAFAEMPDKDKWHVGESASMDGFVCMSPEAAVAGLLVRLETKGAPPAVIVAAEKQVGCAYVPGGSVQFTYRGRIPESKVFVADDGRRFLFVIFDIDGKETGRTYSWIDEQFVSDKPFDPITPGSI